MLIIKTVNELLENENDRSLLNTVAETFQSPNPDIQSFIRDKVIQATNLKTSVTHLVFNADSLKLDLVGFFTLTLKVIRIRDRCLSNSVRRSIKIFSYFDGENDCYNCPAVLIAQFGRNFNKDSLSISGEDLMTLALQQVEKIQSIAGGKVVFLECEPNKKLIDFYEKQGFRLLDDKVLSNTDKELLQMYMIV